jgi:hypothetical protein
VRGPPHAAVPLVAGAVHLDDEALRRLAGLHEVDGAQALRLERPPLALDDAHAPLPQGVVEVVEGQAVALPDAGKGVSLEEIRRRLRLERRRAR